MRRFGYCLISAGMMVAALAGRLSSHSAVANHEQAASASSPAMSAERLDDRIVVRVKDQTFTSYRFGPGQKYPYFYPVNGPLSARTITTESAMPYPHHRSLFFGCDKVNSGNYWQEGNERGQIVSKGATIARNGPDYVQLQDDCEWRQPGQNSIMSDHREIRIEAPSPKLRIIDFSVVLTALTDIRIEQTNHALFSARVEPELSAKSGGTLINAEGATAEKGTYGVASAWCDYSGRHCGFTEGIAIFDSPRNLWFPCKWFTRDYGFFSPTPMEWLGQEGFALKRGERLPLRYRVVIHGGDVRQANIETLFQQWKTAEKGATAP
jgi:hypothetical protein